MTNHSNKSLDLESQVCFDLYSTSLAMTQLYRPLLERFNLTYTQYLVMLVLWQRDKQSLKDISDRLFQQPGALTPVVWRLEKLGLLIRIRSEIDERYIVVTLTERGVALKIEAISLNQCVFEACGLHQKSLDELGSQLKSLRKELHKNVLLNGIDD